MEDILIRETRRLNMLQVFETMQIVLKLQKFDESHQSFAIDKISSYTWNCDWRESTN